jgi:hypothetical protein
MSTITPILESNFEDVYLSFNRLHFSCSLIVARIWTTLTAEKNDKTKYINKIHVKEQTEKAENHLFL